MPLLQAAVAGTLGDVYRADGDDPATALGYDMGTTSSPVGFRAPRWALSALPDARTHGDRLRNRLIFSTRGERPPENVVRPEVWNAAFTMLRAADPGSNTSYYVREGVYETNYAFEYDADVHQGEWKRNIAVHLTEYRSEEMRQRLQAEHQPRVYFYVSAQIADLSRQAEDEHLADHLAAFRMSLERYEQVLSAVRAAGPNESEARAEAERRFIQALPPGLQGRGLEPTRWEGLYRTLFEMSRHRDDSGHHTFGLEYMEAGEVGQIGHLPVTYLIGRRRHESGQVHVRVTRAQSRIPGLRTDEVVRYPG